MFDRFGLDKFHDWYGQYNRRLIIPNILLPQKSIKEFSCSLEFCINLHQLY